MLNVTKKAIVTEILLDKYILKLIDFDDEVVFAGIRGNIKRKESVLVGDIVELETSYDKYMIVKVLDRKNSLIRPPVSNIDQLVIVLAIANPEPDYILLDKQLIICYSKNITPVICINKYDLVDLDETVKSRVEYINRVYGSLGIKIIYTSVKKNIGISDLKEVLKGKISAFSGNSGVGKSSLTKTIIPNIDEKIEVNTIGEKSNRGRHTTKYVKLYNLNKDTYLLDTPGFSSFELFDISYKDLKKYYSEFNKFRCDYEDCSHIKEDESVCEIKRKVEEGVIDNLRYERYVYIYNKLKEKEDRKYK